MTTTPNARRDRRVAAFAAAGPLRNWTLLTAGSVIAISVCVSIGYAFGIEMLKRIAPDLATMKINTAVSMWLASGALFAIRAHRPRLVVSLTVPLFVIGWLGCLGYLFGVKALYAVGPFSSMAGHTATAIVLLAVGLMASSPDGTLRWIVKGDDPGATVLRRNIPTAVLAMPLLAYLQLEGQRHGLYPFAFGVGIMVVVSYDAWIVGNHELRDLTASLESRISERTAALATSEAWARALAGTAPIGIFHCDNSGRRTYVNDQFCTIYGWSRDALLDRAAAAPSTSTIAPELWPSGNTP